MNIEIIIVVGVLIFGFFLFIKEYFSIDVTALIILSCFFGLGYLTPTEAVSGFSNPAVITIGLLFVLSSAIQKTGLLEYIVVTINKLLQSSRTIGMAAYYFTISIASSLINNTAIVAIFMPITIRLAHSYKVSPSKMLIPLSYAAILGGTLTLVGTSTNLLVNSIYMGYEGAEPLGMFEFFKYGIFILIIGTTYLLFIAPKLIPSRTSTSSLTKSYHLGGYLTEMKVSKGSVLIGKSCIDRSINQNYDVTVLDIIRDQKHIANNIRQTILKENDILFVRGTLENFIRMKEVESVTLLTDEKLTQSELEQEDNELVECLLTDDSDLVGKSLMSTNFRQIFGAFILAIRREGGIFRKKIAHIKLQAFDTLLVYGPSKKISNLSDRGDFIVLGKVQARLIKEKFWWVSIYVVLISIFFAAIGFIPIMKGAFISVVILLSLKIITAQESYQSIHWQVIVLIAALIPIGIVIQKTGTAQYIGNNISDFIYLFSDDVQPYALIATIYFITMILTEISSNVATAIIMVPIAIAVSTQLGFEPRPFVFTVAFAASSSFITPIGYQTNLMVYGPGGYKFSDYIRVGLPLSMILFVVAIITIPKIWPF
ncbi:SLC13 family permease [Candidatus Marinimicrobia bacterium]|nr:SLC13 family permease [Candidatus Neomarinimicrobiota bacterium]